jgi:hypothetical protein
MMLPLLLANVMSTYGLAAALAVVCLFLLRQNWQRQKKSQDTASTPEQIKQAATPPTPRDRMHDTPHGILGWEVELHDLARDTKAEIDTKILALQSLMIVANEHCQRLEQLIAQAEKVGVLPPNSGASTSPSANEVLDRIAAGQPLRIAAPTTPREVLSPTQAAKANALARQECSPVQIAREVGATLGEIELYLSLHQDILSNRSD